MERFADLKHLIELAYASQENMDPVIRGELEGNESLLSRSQQRQILKPMLETNIDRLARLSNLLAKESAKMNQQAMQGAQHGQQVSEEQQQQMQQQAAQQAAAQQQAAGWTCPECNQGGNTGKVSLNADHNFVHISFYFIINFMN